MNYRLPRRGARAARAAGRSTRRASATAGISSRRREFAARLASIREDYPARAGLLADEPARQPRHRAAAVDAHAGRRDDGREGARRGERRRRQARAAARLAHPVHACRARRPSTTATRSASPAPTIRTTGARIRGPTPAALPTRRCSPTTARWPRCARTRRRCATETSASCSPTTRPARSRSGARPATQAAIVAINRSDSTRTLDDPGRRLRPRRHVLRARVRRRRQRRRSRGGVLHVTLGPLGGARARDGTVDLEPPAAPTGLARHGRGRRPVSLGWNAVGGAASYAVYRSPLSGGGYVKARRAGRRDDLRRHGPPQRAHRTTTSSARSTRPATRAATRTRCTALPHLDDRLGEPPVAADDDPHDQRRRPHRQRLRPGLDRRRRRTRRARRRALRAQLGFGPDGSNPAGNAAWTWVDAGFNRRRREQRRVRRDAAARAVGTFDYAYRYSTTNGRDWVYADLDGIRQRLHARPGRAADGRPRAATRRRPRCRPGCTSSRRRRPAIELAWDAVAGDPTLYGYEVLAATRRRTVARSLDVTARTTPTRTSTEGATYSTPSARSTRRSTARRRLGAGLRDGAAAARARRRSTSPFRRRRTRPADRRTSPATLSRLQGGLPDWDPGAVALTRVDATHWRVDADGLGGTQLEYKYTLGDWDHVEKDAALRRDRQPQADARLRRERHPDRERHRAELAQRRALRELGGDAGRAPDASGRRTAYLPNAVLGNGSLLVTLSARGELERLFWPHVDRDQHLGELRLGVSDGSGTLLAGRGAVRVGAALRRRRVDPAHALLGRRADARVDRSRDAGRARARAADPLRPRGGPASSSTAVPSSARGGATPPSTSTLAQGRSSSIGGACARDRCARRRGGGRLVGRLGEDDDGTLAHRSPVAGALEAGLEAEACVVISFGSSTAEAVAGLEAPLEREFASLEEERRRHDRRSWRWPHPSRRSPSSRACIAARCSRSSS